MKVGIITLYSVIKDMFSKKIVLVRKTNINSNSYEKKGCTIIDVNGNCAVYNNQSTV